MIITPDIATLRGDQRKDDGKTNRPGGRGQWSTVEVDIPTGRFESPVRLEGLSENLRETLNQFEAGVKGQNGTLT